MKNNHKFKVGDLIYWSYYEPKLIGIVTSVIVMDYLHKDIQRTDLMEVFWLCNKSKGACYRDCCTPLKSLKKII